MRVQVRVLENLIIITPFFMPRIFNLSSMITNIYSAYLYAVLLYIAVVFLYNVHRKGYKAFHSITYLVMIFAFWQMYTAHINHVLYFARIVELMKYIGITVYADYAIQTQSKCFLKSVIELVMVLLFINNLSFFFLNNSSYTDAAGNIIYFLQTKNHLLSYMILLLSATFIYLCIGETHSARKRQISTLVLSNVLATEFFFTSATSLTGLIVFFMTLIVFGKCNWSYRPWMFTIIAFILNVGIVIFRIHYLFSWFIIDVLHKNLTLTNRTQLWDRTLLMIAHKPWFGYGRGSMLELTYTNITVPAHNQLLEIGMQSGVIGILLFLLLFGITIYNIKSNQHKKIDIVVFAAMITYAIAMIAEEVSPYESWFIIMCLAANLKKLNMSWIGFDYNHTFNLLSAKRRKKRLIRCK